MEHVVIIGNGIAGITAARHIRKLSDKKITVISAESQYFFSRTALMYIYMGHMRWKDIQPYESSFWKKNNIQLLQEYVTKVDTDSKKLLLKKGSINYDKLIIASGSVTKTYGWEGMDLTGVQGLISKQDLELLEKNAPNKEVCPRAVIVGGGLIGIELAEMLRSRDIEVTLLVREPAIWENILPLQDAEMVSNHISSHGVDVKHFTELGKILGDKNGKVRGVLTSTGEEIACNLVGIATGVTPNISFLQNSEIELDKGILVDRKLQTNIPNVYAIGDCAQQREPIDNRPTIEAVWYTGRMMGETVAQTICGNSWEYNPGNWFNSAKFFDIEFQTYGWVFSQSQKRDYEEQFHWRCKQEWKALTVSFRKDNGLFLGINTYGIRMRHEVFDKWLSENRTVDFVVKNLQKANFDPEFYRKYDKEIQADFEKAALQKS